MYTILFCQLVGLAVATTTLTCPLSKYCNTTSGDCSNFDSFGQLLNDDLTNCSDYFNFGFDRVIRLIPNRNQILDMNHDRLSDLMNIVFNKKTIDGTYSSFLHMHHLDGIVLSPQFAQLRNLNITYRISYSNFEIYSTDSQRVRIDDCDQYSIMSSEAKAQFRDLMNMLNRVYFVVTSLPSQLCPLIFTNVSMELLSFSYLKNGDHLRFDTISNQTRLNSTISSLSFNGIRLLALDTQVIHPQVFANISSLIILNCSITNIEPVLFMGFRCLKRIVLWISNQKGLFHRGGTQWMQYLNSHIDPIDLDTLILDEANLASIRQKTLGLYFEYWKDVSSIDRKSGFVFLGSTSYPFPDSDFCLFSNFPHQRLVRAGFRAIGITFIQLTCTIMWLMKYELVYNTVGMPSEFYAYPFPFSELNSTLNSCNFTLLLQNCNVTNIQYETEEYITLYSADLFIRTSSAILVTYLGPVFSLIGVVANLLTWLTLVYNKRRKADILNKLKNKDEEIYLLKQPLYKQMLMASVVNFLYCFIYLFDFSIPCKYNSTLESICYEKEVIISVICSALKLFSNYCVIQMSLHRYLLIGQGHWSILEKLANLSGKVFFLINLAFACSLSVVIYFQQRYMHPFYFVSQVFFNSRYQYSSYYEISQFYSIYSRNAYSGIAGSDYIASHILNQAQNEVDILFIGSLVHDIFSYLLFCLFSLAIDILTISKLRETIKEKEAKSGAKFDKEKFTECERKGITMLVASSLTNFLLRMPEILSVVFLYIFTSDGYKYFIMCVILRHCPAMLDLANSFYIVSLSTNLIFYVKFNSNFRLSFNKLIQRILKPKEKT